MKRQTGFRVFCAAFFFTLVFAVWAQAPRTSADSLFPGAPSLGSRSAVVMDATTGTLIFYQNPDEEIPPASLTKLMTMHLAFEAIAEGRVSLDDVIYPPRASWAINQPPGSSLMYLASGQRLTLQDLLLGLSIFSGNDAAVAVALHLAPSVEAFAEMMNQEAASLGFEKTRFVEPSGISEFNITTAREYAEFCRFYMNAHPDAIRNYHSVPSFSYPREENILDAYRNEYRTRLHWNHNYLLGRVEGVDGLKTGYIDESGYNIALTAERNETRFIAVILGAPSEEGGDDIRDEDGKNLLNWAFDRYQTVRPLDPEIQPVRVWKGKPGYAGLVPKEALEFTAPVDRAQALYAQTFIKEPLVAPLPAGTDAGFLVISDDKGELHRVSLVTETAVPEGNIFRRLLDSILMFFKRNP